MEEIKKNDIKIYQFPMVDEEDEEEDTQDLQVLGVEQGIWGLQIL